MKKEFNTRIIFTDYDEASEAMKMLCKIKRENGVVTYGDFYRIKTPFVKIPMYWEDYGWLDLMGMSVELNYDSMMYELIMPQIINLKERKSVE